MLYREIIAVCSEIHTKHINTLFGQNIELLNVKLVIHTGSLRLKRLMCLKGQKSFVKNNGCQFMTVTHYRERQLNKKHKSTPTM